MKTVIYEFFLDYYLFKEMTVTHSNWHILCSLQVQVPLSMGSLYMIFCH